MKFTGNKCFAKSMVWKAWIPIYNLCDGVGIGCTTKFHQNAKYVLYIYIYNVIEKNHQIGCSKYWLTLKKIDPN
jgi:hypothetical protein